MTDWSLILCPNGHGILDGEHTCPVCGYEAEPERVGVSNNGP